MFSCFNGWVRPKAHVNYKFSIKWQSRALTLLIGGTTFKTTQIPMTLRGTMLIFNKSILFNLCIQLYDITCNNDSLSSVKTVHSILSSISFRLFGIRVGISFHHPSLVVSAVSAEHRPPFCSGDVST